MRVLLTRVFILVWCFLILLETPDYSANFRSSRPNDSDVLGRNPPLPYASAMNPTWVVPPDPTLVGVGIGVGVGVDCGGSDRALPVEGRGQAPRDLSSANVGGAGVGVVGSDRGAVTRTTDGGGGGSRPTGHRRVSDGDCAGDDASTAHSSLTENVRTNS